MAYPKRIRFWIEPRGCISIGLSPVGDYFLILFIVELSGYFHDFTTSIRENYFLKMVGILFLAFSWLLPEPFC